MSSPRHLCSEPQMCISSQPSSCKMAAASIEIRITRALATLLLAQITHVVNIFIDLRPLVARTTWFQSSDVIFPLFHWLEIVYRTFEFSRLVQTCSELFTLFIYRKLYIFYSGAQCAQLTRPNYAK